ncbi:hypothetical protein BGY98DRAFT_470640 [Russula aff. rugulosa BPL654]|nr:hypothetical protein BGY98DRAFT_470640 [Russula aff. rugulosa BPL654]
MVSFLSCSRFFILWAALCFDLSASSLAIVFRSFLNVSHRICGFKVARSVGSCSSVFLGPRRCSEPVDASSITHPVLPLLYLDACALTEFLQSYLYSLPQSEL